MLDGPVPGRPAGPDASTPAALTPLRSLARRPALTALVLLVGVGAGLLASVLRVADPVATAVVLLTPESDEGAPLAGRSTREQAAIARLPAVRSAAAEAVLAAHPALGLDRAALEERLRVTVPRRTDTLSLAFRAPTEDAARTGAEAAVETYVRLRARQVVQQAELALRRLDALDRQLARGESDALEQARGEVQRLRGAALLTRAAPETEVGRVLAVSVRGPRSVSPPVAAGAGLLAALFPALVLGHGAASRQARQDRPGDARPVLGVASLGTVSHCARRRLPVRDDPRSVAAQGYRVVAAAVPLRLPGDEPAPVVAVVGAARSGSWPGTLLANVAQALAGAGHHVAVVGSADGPALALLRRSTSSTGSRGAGGIVLLSAAQQASAHPDVELVLLEVPDLTSPGAGTRLAGDADAAVVVVPRRSSTADLERLRRTLDELQVPVRGYVHLRPGLRRTTVAPRASGLRPSSASAGGAA